MKPALILLVGAAVAEAQLLQKTLDSRVVRIVALAEAAAALAKIDELRPDLVLIGSGIPRDHAQWMLERMMASSTQRAIPVVLIFYESSRSWVLEMIKLGLRAYIQLPREREDFRRRLAQHLPAGTFSEQPRTKQPMLRESVGERLRQRIAKKQVENAVSDAGSKSGVDLKRPIPLLEQQYAEDCGLTVRISSREISLFEKIDDYLLRFGGSNSHVVGIFMGLLVEGKIRVAFRDKTERLSLVDPEDKKTGEAAIQLIDAYLSQGKASVEPDTRTQKIIL